MNIIDNFLNQITMYRLVLYFLIYLLLVALILSFLGLLPFSPISLIATVIFVTLICWAVNTVFAGVFKVSVNAESFYISALILCLIITPVNTLTGMPFLFWAATLAMVSKYILAIGRKHIFNPVALSVTLTSFVINQSASWWIGTFVMLPFLLPGGLLVIRKTKRLSLVLSFLFVSLTVISGASFLKGIDFTETLSKALSDSPVLFFSFIMLTEPLTTPPTKFLQIVYGGLVGFLFTPQLNYGSFYTTPEIALIIGNIFSYIVSPKDRLILKLKEKIQSAPTVADFIFESGSKLNFNAGQYLEWTLGYKNPDTRGNRRYFTIASSPTEEGIRLGVKIYDNPSGFKKALLGLNKGGEIVASQLAGEFTLPKNPALKLVFIAGGIGITPFRSMIKYIIDTNQKRDIVLFYSNKTISEIVYKDIFNQAKDLGLKTVYTLTDTNSVPAGWQGSVGIVSRDLIAKEVSDYKERTFYLSGPHTMVVAFEKTLKDMGLNSSQIKTDYFPGFV